MEHHPKEQDHPAEWGAEDRRQMAASPLAQKALRRLDEMVVAITGEITDVSMPAYGGFASQPELFRERAVFHRGRLELLNDLRDSIFGADQ